MSVLELRHDFLHSFCDGHVIFSEAALKMNNPARTKCQAPPKWRVNKRETYRGSLPVKE